MSKRTPKGRVKNPCRICNQTVAQKSGVQCKGACARWAHYKCLGYSPQKILDIKDGVIKITCPCPNCSPKVPVEEVVKPRRIGELFPNHLPLGDVPCLSEDPYQLPRKQSSSPRKQSPGQSPRIQSPGESPSSPRQQSPSGLENLPPCHGPPQANATPRPLKKETPNNATRKQSPCSSERPCQPAPRSLSLRQPSPRKQNLFQPFLRRQTARKKPSYQEHGDLEAPCQPNEEAPLSQRPSLKCSCIKPKDDFASNPSFDPQLFQPTSFKPESSPCDVTSSHPPSIPPLLIPSPCDTVKCRASPQKIPAPVSSSPSSPRGSPLPCEPPAAKSVIARNKYDDCKTPPLSRTPSKISLVSPKLSPKQSKDANLISCKTPSPLLSPKKSPSSSRTSTCPLSGTNANKLPNTNITPKISLTKNNERNHPISATISLTKPPQNYPASTVSSSSKHSCKKSAPCQAPPPDTSLSCCKTCKNCKCSSNLNLLKSNCISPICPKKVLAKALPKAPPPSLKSVPFENKATRPKSDKTSSEKNPCVNCTSSICHCPPSSKSVETCTEKKTKSCGCLTVLRGSQIRSAVSDSRITKTGQTMLFSAIDQLCATVGQLSGQIKMLMSKMRVCYTKRDTADKNITIS